MEWSSSLRHSFLSIDLTEDKFMNNNKFNESPVSITETGWPKSKKSAMAVCAKKFVNDLNQGWIE